MRLYHGSNIAVETPCLMPVHRKLDFGQGFYTTSDFEQASRWAKRTLYRRKEGAALVSVYQLEDYDMERLAVKKFKAADAEWLSFVTANRTGVLETNAYDIIAGPVANDQTMTVINLYLDGLYDTEETLRRLLTQNLTDQLVFKTGKAIEALRFVEAIEV